MGPVWSGQMAQSLSSFFSKGHTHKRHPRIQHASRSDSRTSSGSSGLVRLDHEVPSKNSLEDKTADTSKGGKAKQKSPPKDDDRAAPTTPSDSTPGGSLSPTAVTHAAAAPTTMLVSFLPSTWPMLPTAMPTSISTLSSSDVTATPSSTSPSSSAFRAIASPAPSASVTASPSSGIHTNKAMLVGVGIGVSLMLLGFAFIIKAYSKPAKRRWAQPSHPFPMESDKYVDEDSPVFGGKERFSVKNGDADIENGAPLPWVTYTPPSKRLTSAGAPGYVAQGTGLNHVSNERVQLLNRSASRQNRRKSLAQAGNTMKRAVSRLSMGSISLYPESPVPNVGIAIDDVTPFTGDGQQPHIRRYSRAARKRTSTNLGSPKTFDDSTLVSESSAYDGADVASPVLMQTATHVKIPVSAKGAIVANGHGGRARVKSTYIAPGSYPRVSAGMPDSTSGSSKTAVTAYPYATSNSGTPLYRTDSQRNRDTRALTSALGLASPDIDAASPQPTIYPDDSLSVMVTKASKPKGSSTRKKPAPSVRFSSDLMTPELPLGSFTMLTPPPGSAQQDRSRPARSADKPPRVPSPPTLPSLSQMAMQIHNPEAYADYHSPTYSMYGLYNNEDAKRGRTTSFMTGTGF